MGCCDSKPDSPTASARSSDEEPHSDAAWCGRKKRSKSQGSALVARGQQQPNHGPGSLSEGTTCHLHMPASQIRREIMKLQYREVTPEDYELLCLLDESLPKKNTLPEALVQGLPLVPVVDRSSKCQVCLLELGDTKVPQLPCGHVFHFECACKWFTSCSARCPVCQVSILDPPMAPPSAVTSDAPASSETSPDSRSWLRRGEDSESEAV
ncbi:ATL7 [Symbiodinium pilosum]|uniref:RING-type E3 ubiquitin transferase n=1 Tax=Symbiodinium pilosum TaxID=2952 RepID=A0A812XLL0_SYMPI|nr:ATL7 [Symbiodinium pilosum]